MLIQPAFSEIIKLQPGDILLLCSDGLTDMVSEKDIAVCLANGGTPEQQAAALLQMALAAGGRDNVTALVAKVCKDPHPLLRRIFPA